MSDSPDNEDHTGAAQFYTDTVCPNCGKAGQMEFVPIASCEALPFISGEDLRHCVYCACGTTYYALYNYFIDGVGLIVPPPELVLQTWMELLYEQRN